MTAAPRDPGRSGVWLVRLPGVLAAVANVAAGAMLARGAGRLEPSDGLSMLAAACLYLGAAVLDDGEEGAARPIRSGQGAEALLGFGLLGLGVGMAALVSTGAGLVAVLVAGALALYHLRLASTAVGPAVLGGARFGNVVLGFAAVPWPDDWRWVAPAAVGFYACILGYLSRDQSGGAAIERTRAAAQMMLVVLVAFLVVIGTGSPAATLGGLLDVAPFLAVLVARGLELFVPLTRSASPPVIARAVGGGILLMPVVAATSVAAAGFPVAAAAVAVVTVPAMLLAPDQRGR